LLIRTWNLFHGNTVPPGRTNLLEDAVRLAASGDPATVCLQEVPAWALEYLDDWSGMIAIGEVAARPRAGRELGRRLTVLNPGRIRSALAGQANAILVAAGIRIRERHSIVLNPRRLRRQIDLPTRARLAWATERRICQAVRLGLADGRTLTVANLHATSYPADARFADAEVLRAAVFLDATAAPEDIAVLAGDFNLQAGRSPALRELEKWGFAGPGPGIDHVLVRGAPAGPPERWPEERRRIGGALVSDHAPVDVVIE
jgi:endonuclease/exonuclease/phosphatase family metal-dependent hydrolase